MVDLPRNAFTDIIDAAKARNVSGVYTRPEGASADPRPTVRSADLGTETPLTPDEIAERDALAIEAGIKDPSLGNDGPDADGLIFNGGYASEADVEAAKEQARVADSRQIAREFMGAPARGVFVKMTPTMPDFKNVEKIDFAEHTLVVGGMAFPMPKEMEIELRKRVIQTVAAEVKARIDLALDALGAEATVEETNARGEGGPAAGA